jgi:hypothetical protein
VFPIADVLRLTVGWIGKKVSRRRDRHEVLESIATELHELRFVLAGVLVLAHSKRHTMNQPVVDLIRPVMLAYKGNDGDRAMVEATSKLLAQGDAAFIAAHNTRPIDPAKAYYPVPYSTPVLASHIGQLTLFPVAVQKHLLRVSQELQLYNEQVAIVRAAHDRTFDTSLSAANYAANEQNLKTGTDKLATRAAQLVEAINEVVDSSGKPR